MISRLLALLIGIFALAALRARHDSLPASIARLGLPDRLWHLSGHLAVVAGLAAAVAFLAVARGWRIGPRAAAALVTALALSALVTPALPGPIWPLSDPLVLSSSGLALGLPLAGLLWWLAFAPKALAMRDLPWLLAFPLAFLAAACLRELALGGSPEPVLGAPLLPAALTWAALALALGLVVIALGRLMTCRT